MKFTGRRISGQVAGGQLVVRFRIRYILSLNEVSATAREIESALDRHRARQLVLNFRGVKQMSSQMLGRILQLKKLVESRGGELRVCALTQGAREGFNLARFGKIVAAYETEAEALAG